MIQINQGDDYSVVMTCRDSTGAGINMEAVEIHAVITDQCDRKVREFKTTDNTVKVSGYVVLIFFQSTFTSTLREGSYNLSLLVVKDGATSATINKKVFNIKKIGHGSKC